jgi:hypothetical protein
MEKLKYGKLPHVPTGECYMMLGDYLDYSVLPPLPASFGVNRCAKIAKIGMLANDKVGDCTVAAMVHMFMLWIANAQGVDPSALFTDKITLAVYSAITGYDPNIPQSDRGAQMQDVCNYFINTGVKDVNGKLHKLAAKIKIDVTNWQEVKYAEYLFESVYMGIQVPDTAQAQFWAGEPWTYEPGSAFEGGHAIPGFAWDNSEEYDYVLTWGAIQKATYGFMQACLIEGWVVLSQEMLNSQGVTVEGLNWAQLQSDAAALHGIDPNPTPTPTPTPTPPTPTPTPPAPTQRAKQLTIVLGLKTMIADGKTILLDQPAIVDPVTNRALLPVHALADNMGYSVQWLEATETIILKDTTVKGGEKEC